MSHPLHEVHDSHQGLKRAHDAAEPAASTPRRNRVVIALAAVAALMFVGVTTVTALLIGAHRDAAELAAAEGTEDEQQADELRSGERQLDNAEARLADAQADAGYLSTLAEEAETALEQAERAAAPGQAELQAFLDLLRDNNAVFFTVPDANLIELGRSTCDYLDTFGATDQNMAHVIDVGVASGIPAQLSIEVTAVALTILCPHHEIG